MLIMWTYVDTIKETPETIIDTSKEVGLQVNVEKIMYV
jgi:hypothetical protein